MGEAMICSWYFFWDADGHLWQIGLWPDLRWRQIT